MRKCAACAQNRIVVTEYGSLVCTACGVEDLNFLLTAEAAHFSYSLPLQPHQTYTRQKRFRKYLQRAAMQQGGNSVPQATWEYMFAGMPYRGPKSIIARLKHAPKHVRKKCYDSLPMLVKTLCPHIRVPVLLESDKYSAMSAFRRLDRAYLKGEPFVSYLFALEYILELVGRSDVCEYLNKIQCRKRRAAYRYRLDKIFKRSRTPACTPGTRVAF